MIDKMLIRGANVRNRMRLHLLSDLNMKKAVDLS